MKFTIGFEKEDAKKLHEYWDEIIENQQWSEGKFTGKFEEKWPDESRRVSFCGSKAWKEKVESIEKGN
jgi:hypothetical protein